MTSFPPSLINQVVLEAQVLEKGLMRYTPAGLPALDVRLEQVSTQTEAGLPRRVRLEIRALALGDMATQLEAVPLDSSRQYSGFLASPKSGRGVVLRIARIAE